MAINYNAMSTEELKKMYSKILDAYTQPSFNPFDFKIEWKPYGKAFRPEVVPQPPPKPTAQPVSEDSETADKISACKPVTVL